MPSLYTQKDSNIKKTWMLFSMFLIFIIGIGWLFSYIFNNQAILIFAVLFSVITSFISYWHSDKIALSLSGAKEVKREDNKYLYHIVENLSIASGLPMPRLYVIPDRQINAFATGRNPQNAAVAVTEGALERLEKSELEGVLAHEMSHIGNRDILVSTIAVVLAGIISLLSDFFIRSLLWGDRDRDRGSGLLILIGIAFAVLAPISAMLIQLAISRKREFLADASGALLTRYPEGLARALEKIAADNIPMKRARDATAHLWISNPFKSKKTSFMHKLFMTHPPIEERIAALRGMKI